MTYSSAFLLLDQPYSRQYSQPTFASTVVSICYKASNTEWCTKIVIWLVTMNVPSMASRTNQMRLYDLRLVSEKAVVLSFGCTENDSVSRYLRPDWKPDAWIVSSGNMADHKIHIWYNDC